MMREVRNIALYNSEDEQFRELLKVVQTNKHRDRCQSGRLLSEWRFESSSEPQNMGRVV